MSELLKLFEGEPHISAAPNSLTSSALSYFGARTTMCSATRP
jgi:hypothetical protein